jgi:hypothetical protein
MVAVVGAVMLTAALATPAQATRAMPDLIVDAAFTAQTWAVVDVTFDAASCAVQEGVITAGSHRLIVFGIKTANVGTTDLRVGTPKKNDPANWVYYACHNHWHFVRYAEYTLLDGAGNVAGVGHKQSFCIEDYGWYYNPPPSINPRYTCDHQGLSVGWADIYGSGLDGQWVVIDAVPSGSYTLRITVNYAQVLPESDYTNNTVSVAVTIP